MAITKKDQDIKNNYIELVILYFKYRNTYNLGYQRYSVYRNLIRFITDNNDLKFCRTIFSELQKRKLFQKKIVIKSIYYRFNAYPNRYKNSDKDVSFKATESRFFL